MKLIKNIKAVRLRTGLLIGIALAIFIAGWSVREMSYDNLASGAHPQVGLIWSSDVDPTVGAGVNAPQWQLLIRTDTDQIYFKSGNANTAWTSIGVGPGGGTVTSVGCGTNMACTPSPIVAAGSVATVASPTFSTVILPDGNGGFNTISHQSEAVFIDSNAGLISKGGIVGGIGATVQTGTGGDIQSDTTILAGTTITAGTFITVEDGSHPSDIKAGAGNPNGITSGHKGSIYMDVSAPQLYQNSDGAMAWSVVGGSTANQMFDTVLNASLVGASFSTFNDVSFGGVLGKVNYVMLTQTGSQYTITGFDASSAVDGTVVFLQSITTTAACPTAWRLNNDDVGSLAANRILVPGGVGVTTTSACQGGEWFRYDGNVSRWRVLEKV